MKIVYSGLESSGKSLMLARIVADVAWRNHKWKKKTKIVRPIHSNLQFSEQFYTYVTVELGIPIHYWKNLDELVEVRDADVLCDEIGNYFDARMWADLSLDVRAWLQQAAKMGVEMYCTAQDFAQIDKSFRRLVNELYLITKIIGSPRPAATRPPVTHIWGVCWKRELDPRSYEEDNKKAVAGLGGIGWPFFIRQQDCDRFDTKQRIPRSSYPHLKKIVQTCLEDGFVRTRYI